MTRADTERPTAVAELVMLARLEYDITGHQAEVLQDLIKTLLETGKTVTLEVT